MFSHITIVNIDGRHGELTAAQLSLAHSARELPGAQALLLSPQRPKNLLQGIQHIPIQSLACRSYYPRSVASRVPLMKCTGLRTRISKMSSCVSICARPWNSRAYGLRRWILPGTSRLSTCGCLYLEGLIY